MPHGLPSLTSVPRTAIARGGSDKRGAPGDHGNEHGAPGTPLPDQGGIHPRPSNSERGGGRSATWVSLLDQRAADRDRKGRSNERGAQGEHGDERGAWWMPLPNQGRSHPLPPNSDHRGGRSAPLASILDQVPAHHNHKGVSDEMEFQRRWAIT